MWGLPCQQGSSDNGNTRDEEDEERSKRTGDEMETRDGDGMEEG